MADESLSEKRRRAGKAGATARWGARNNAATSANGSGDGIVYGTAAELREMADAIADNDTPTLTRSRASARDRLTAFQAKHPRAQIANLVGRPWCEALADPTVEVANWGMPPYKVRGDDTTEMWVCDEISMWGILAADVIEQLNEIDSGRILVHLNSPGGDVFEGLQIRRALMDHPADVYVSIESLAASIASVIAMAGDTIGIDDLALMMIHDASGFCYGNAADMSSMANLLDKVSDTVAQAYALHVEGTKAKDWRKRMLAEEWFTAPEAISDGLADELLGAEAEAEPVAASGSSSLLAAFAQSTRPQPEPLPAHTFLRAVKEASRR